MAEGLTRELAAYAAQARFGALPEQVRAEGARAFLNWVGCVLGGCHEPAVALAVAGVLEAGSHPQATLIGHGKRADTASAAFINCLSSTVLSFDDTHLSTVTHPTGPVAAAAFAVAERQPVSGEDFLTALVVGMEIECRLSTVLLLPPAQANLGLFITGITGPVGAAVAAGRLLGFDAQRMRWAICLAATQSAGIRSGHGSMAAFFVPANAARSGTAAALLAARGVTGTDHVLEAPSGFVEVYGRGGDPGRATNDLGIRFELLANAYKPYPSGIVVQPAIDACLDIAQRIPAGAAIASAAFRVHPLTLDLCGRRDPADPVQAQISLFHWAAVVLLQQAAGLAQLRQECIDDPAVAALRSRITARADASLRRDEAHAEVTLADGTVLRCHVEHARGSAARPMTDAELDAKYRGQAREVLPPEACENLLRLCRGVAQLQDVGREVGAAWPA